MTEHDRKTVERLKTDILNDLLEMDDLGLWEPLWTLNTLYPDRPTADRQAIAEEALRELYRSGLITLYRHPWETGRGETAPPLTSGEVESELQASWWRELPLPSGDVWIKATPEAIARRPAGAD